LLGKREGASSRKMSFSAVRLDFGRGMSLAAVNGTTSAHADPWYAQTTCTGVKRGRRNGSTGVRGAFSAYRSKSKYREGFRGEKFTRKESALASSDIFSTTRPAK